MKTKSNILAIFVAITLLSSMMPVSAHGSGVLVEDQEYGHGQFVIASLNITETTLWVVVHHDDNGSPGEIKANMSVAEGHYTDFNYTFPEIDHTETLWVMLHNDTTAGDDFNPTVDVPRTKHDNIIMDDFVLSPHGHDDETSSTHDDDHDDSSSASASDTADSPGFLVAPAFITMMAGIGVRLRNRKN